MLYFLNILEIVELKRKNNYFFYTYPNISVLSPICFHTCCSGYEFIIVPIFLLLFNAIAMMIDFRSQITQNLLNLYYIIYDANFKDLLFLFLLVRQIDKRFGVVTSFQGTYVANQWSVELSNDTNVGRFVQMFCTCPSCFSCKQREEFSPHINRYYRLRLRYLFLKYFCSFVYIAVCPVIIDSHFLLGFSISNQPHVIAAHQP